MKLVTFERDWADEFSPFGFAIMHGTEFEEFKAYYSVPRDWGFGTNEGFDQEIAFESCKVKDITEEEAERLILLFNLPQPNDWRYLERGLFPPKPELEDEEV